MPQYVFRRGGKYLFRQAVPSELRTVVGKREIKRTLGSDRSAACLRGKTIAVEVETLFLDARACLARHAATLAARSRPKHSIKAITPQLRGEFKALWLSIVDVADVQRRASGFASISQAEVSSQNDEVASIFRQALITGDVGPVLQPMLEALYFAGYELDENLHGSQAERELAVDFARAVLAGTKLLEARDVGDDLPLPTIQPLPNLNAVASASRAEVTIPVPSSDDGLPLQAHLATAGPVSHAGLTLSDAIKHFLDNWKRGEPMRLKLVSVLNLFLTYTGDRPIAQLRQMHINNFFDFVQRLPPRWADECRRRKIGVVHLAEIDHPKTIGPKTFEDTYLAAFRLFLKAAKRNWQDVGFPTTLTTEATYYSGNRKAGEQKQRAFTMDELRTVFEGKQLLEYSQNESQLHKYWLPVLGLHTGARVNELCQLNPQHDVAWIGEILTLNITEETEGADDVKKSVKNEPSKRRIPVHKKLIELGFADYVATLQESGAQQLFPAWKPYRGKASANAAKWHARWLQSQRVNIEERSDGRKLRGSHAYRHTLLTYGRSAGLMLWDVSGHSKSIQDDRNNPVALGYEDSEIVTPLLEKQKALDALEYGLNIPKPVKLSVGSARRIIAGKPKSEERVAAASSSGEQT